MLEWYYDEQGAISDMPGIGNPLFTVSEALDGNGFIAVERFPGGLVVAQPVPNLDSGVAWCNEAAQQILQFKSTASG